MVNKAFRAETHFALKVYIYGYVSARRKICVLMFV